MARLFSRTEYARLRGCAKSFVTKLCDGPLKEAVVAGQIDVDHPAAQADLATKGVTQSKIARGPTKGDKKPSKRTQRIARAPTSAAKIGPKPAKRPTEAHQEAAPPGAPATEVGRPLPTIEQLEAIREALLPILGGEHGTTTREISNWLDIAKVVEDIIAKRLANEQAEGRLISRDLVRGHVFSWVDGLARKLLRDSSKTIVRRVYAMAKSGADIEAAEAVARENMSAQIQPAKAQIAKALRGP
jgi:hypothetical protein